MDEDEFIETVREEARLDSADESREIITATLETLGERITDGAAANLAPQLPDGLADPLADPNIAEAEEFTVNVFIDRVAARADIDESEVPIRTHAVFKTIAEAGGDLQTAREQLPPVFDLLFEPGPLLQRDEFLDTIQERSDIDSADVAHDAAMATLATLGEALTGGQAADIATYLPAEFKGLLTESDLGTAVSYSTDEFIAQVAQREGIEGADAEMHVQAVLSVVAEAASDRELGNTTKQLPDEFEPLFDI